MDGNSLQEGQTFPQQAFYLIGHLMCLGDGEIGRHGAMKRSHQAISLTENCDAVATLYARYVLDSLGDFVMDS